MSDEKKIVVITGASRGIGRATAVAFAKPGTEIFFNYFSPADPEGEQAAADETSRLVEAAGAKAHGFVVDVSAADAVKEFFDKVVEAAGTVNVLVNNAGITRDTLLVRMKPADFDAVLSINLKGAFYCLQNAAKIMMKARRGRIINIASIVGVTGNPGQANYVSAKAGLIGLTKTAAKELAPRNITVNAIAPGFIETDMTAVLSEKARAMMLAGIPLGRAGQPEDVANAIAFLASDQADYITGQVIHVSGGMYM